MEDHDFYCHKCNVPLDVEDVRYVERGSHERSYVILGEDESTYFADYDSKVEDLWDNDQWYQCERCGSRLVDGPLDMSIA